MHSIRHLPSSNGNGVAQTISYERYLVDAAIELGLEIAHHLETLGKNLPDKDEAKLMMFNSRRAYSVVDTLRRIELVR